MIPDSFKQDLLNRADIVDVVGRYVQLKKGGANFMGLCPFHDEKTPSFTVSPAKQFYHCFGCQKHGNAIGFLMDYGGMGYIDALKELASGVGMQVPEWQPRTPQEAEQKERESDLFAVMQQAMEFYRGTLKSSPRAVAYLKQRGLTGEIAARFGIGYAPDDWQGLKAAFPDYDSAALVECGLVIEGEGKRYDRFRDRILFPIFNRRDAVVGFGGRVLGEGEPKYLNSPETPLFRKGEEIYGLGHARAAMHEAKRALVVEGYMDVVALAQHGVGYAVATLGTATTPAHVAKLLRELRESGAELVFSFDGDAAGRKAAWRALEVSLPLAGDSNPVKFLFLPEGEDPDSFVRAQGKAAFERLVAEAQTLSGFLLGALRAAVDLSTPEGCSRFLASAEPYLKKLTAQRLRLQILKEVAAISGFTQDEVEQNIGRTDGIAKAQPVREKRSHVSPRSQEWALLQCVAMVPSLVPEIDFSVVDMRLPESQTLNEIAAWYQTNARPDVTTAMLIDHFQDGPQAAMVAAAQGYAMEVGFREDDLRQSFKLTILKLGIDRRNVNIRALGERLRKGELSKEEHLEYGHMISEVKALERKLQLEGRPASQGDVGAA